MPQNTRASVPIVPLESGGQTPLFVDYTEDWNSDDEGGYQPHRHDYHEILWIQSGYARHTVDDRSIELPPQTIALVTRGQIHRFEETRAVTCYAIGFWDELLLHGEGLVEITLLFNYLSALDYMRIPADNLEDFAALFSLINAEHRRETELRKREYLVFLLSALLIRIQRLQAHAYMGQKVHEPNDYQHYQTFLRQLEQDFEYHHSVAHYAQKLHLSAHELSRILSRVVGHSAKQIIDDRLLLEAKRLLQFTDLSVKSIAASLGYPDPYHFSKRFKQAIGRTPLAYRRQWQKY